MLSFGRLLGDVERNFFLTAAVVSTVVAASADQVDVLLTFVSDDLTGFFLLATLFLDALTFVDGGFTGCDESFTVADHSGTDLFVGGTFGAGCETFALSGDSSGDGLSVGLETFGSSLTLCLRRFAQSVVDHQAAQCVGLVGQSFGLSFAGLLESCDNAFASGDVFAGGRVQFGQLTVDLSLGLVSGLLLLGSSFELTQSGFHCCRTFRLLGFTFGDAAFATLADFGAACTQVVGVAEVVDGALGVAERESFAVRRLVRRRRFRRICHAQRRSRSGCRR